MLRPAIVLFTSVSGLALLFASACSDDVELSQSGRVKAPFNTGGAAGESGAGGAGGETSSLPSQDDYDAAVENYVAALRECDLIDSGDYNAPRWQSTPATVCILECLLDLDDCDALAGLLCDAKNSDWEACQEQCATFTCKDGTDIPSWAHCDTWLDCEDGSDEIGCQAMWFECGDGTPVLNSQVCDLTYDCLDGSDETSCKGDGLRCDYDYVVPPWRVCDGIQDCADGTDEGSDCAELACE